MTAPKGWISLLCHVPGICSNFSRGDGKADVAYVGTDGPDVAYLIQTNQLIIANMALRDRQAEGN